MRKNQNNPPFGADGSALFHNPQANACIFLKLHARDAARAIIRRPKNGRARPSLR